MRHRFLLLVIAFLFYTTTASALHLQGSPWPNGEVMVCWQSDSFDLPATAAFSPLIRDAVDDTWGRNANIRFVDWGRCSGTKMPKGWVVLSWKFGAPTFLTEEDYGYSKSRATPIELSPSGSLSTIREYALHEFGHALGFGAEEESPRRKSTDVTCSSAKATGSKDLTPYDKDSIMWCGGDGVLSGWDIVGLRIAYGFKPAGTLVGLNNRALDVPGSNTSTGISLQVWNQHGDSNQVWSRSGVHVGTLQAKFLGVRRCADVPVPSKPETGLITDACNTSDRQRFAFKDVAIRGIGEKCLDIPNAEVKEGQIIQLYDCHGGKNQQWTIETSGRIRAGSSGYCLDVPDNDAEKKALLQLYPCHDGPAQKFTFRSNGEIRFRTLCLDTQDAVPANGARLQLDSCKGKGAQNQRFHLTGPVKNEAGLCLDIRGGVAFDGAAAQMYTCDEGAANQIWDYYFK